MISEFPLFLFTLLGGMAAGSYAFAAALPQANDESSKPFVLPAASLALLAVGGLALLAHLGHPERMLLAMSNPQAGITLEAYTMIGFGVLVLADLVITLVKGKSMRGLRFAAAALGILLCCAMGYAYAQEIAVAAWSTPAVWPMFIIGNLAMGGALWGLINRGAYDVSAFRVTTGVVGLAFAATCAALSASFAGAGHSVAPFIVGLACAVGAAACCLAKSAKLATSRATIVFALMLVALAVSRYAFYAAA